MSDGGTLTLNETENVNKIIYFLHYIFSSISIFSVLVELDSKKFSITIWLTYNLYFNTFQLYIELTEVFDKVLREIQWVLTSKFPI